MWDLLSYFGMYLLSCSQEPLMLQFLQVNPVVKSQTTSQIPNQKAPSFIYSSQRRLVVTGSICGELLDIVMVRREAWTSTVNPLALTSVSSKGTADMSVVCAERPVQCLPYCHLFAACQCFPRAAPLCGYKQRNWEVWRTDLAKVKHFPESIWFESLIS